MHFLSKYYGHISKRNQKKMISNQAASTTEDNNTMIITIEISKNELLSMIDNEDRNNKEYIESFIERFHLLNKSGYFNKNKYKFIMEALLKTYQTLKTHNNTKDILVKLCQRSEELNQQIKELEKVNPKVFQITTNEEVEFDLYDNYQKLENEKEILQSMAWLEGQLEENNAMIKMLSESLFPIGTK